MQSAEKKFWIFFMTQAVMLIAPFKALSTPVNALPDEPCASVRACCQTMQYCCCEIAPRLPADLDNAATLPSPPKFVSIKGSGRIVSQELPRPIMPRLQHSAFIAGAPIQPVTTVPLYILNRALLI